MLATTVLVAATGVAACSEDAPSSGKLPSSSGGTDTDAGVGSDTDASAERAAPKVYARALCDFYRKCDPIEFRRLYVTLETCNAKLLPQTTAALSAPGNVVTAAELAACTSKLGVTCDDTLFTIPECEFRGTQPNDTKCAFGGQCSGAECRGRTPSECGTCGSVVGGGLDCSSGALCANGFVCLDGACRAPVGEGATCASSAYCKATLVCIDGTCKPRLGLDAACDSANDGCDRTLGLECIPTGPSESTGTCQPPFFAKVGEDCGFNAATGLTTYCEGSACKGLDAPGKCTAFQPEGSDCFEDEDLCDVGLTCLKGKCQALDPAQCK